MHVKYSTKLKLNDRSMEIYRRSPAAKIVDIYTIFGIWRKDKDGNSPEIYTEMKYMYITNESKHENYNMRSRKMHLNRITVNTRLTCTFL